MRATSSISLEPRRQTHPPIREGSNGIASSTDITGAAYVGCHAPILGKAIAALSGGGACPPCGAPALATDDRRRRGRAHKVLEFRQGSPTHRGHYRLVDIASDRARSWRAGGWHSVDRDWRGWTPREEVF